MKLFLLLVLFFTLGLSLETLGAGETLFIENCVSCHGVAGHGDGPLAADLDTPPADLTQISKRRGGIWPMLEIMSILDGYSRNTLPREDMPIFEGFLDNDMVEFDTGNGVKTLVPSKLVAMADYLETLQDPAPEAYVP
ncbi:cytochrome C [Sulfitobacter sp. SK012]|uniref:c-type cytochrome n=1 Tax=Sulfitobacter sp. SK012 TaxID=1389005 RepID=UPI000E0A51D1|nr:cytochrome c [Sulfitobacter sp. SK012]AXI47637.1 cytochrome C [Sulfitobacter sp. SK012]